MIFKVFKTTAYDLVERDLDKKKTNCLKDFYMVLAALKNCIRALQTKTAIFKFLSGAVVNERTGSYHIGGIKF